VASAQNVSSLLPEAACWFLTPSGSVHVVDRAALAAHFAMPHLAQWRSQFAVLGITERNLELVEGEAEST